MLSFLIHLLSFTGLNNSYFIQDHNSKNLSYQVEKNQFYYVNYTDEFNNIQPNVIFTDKNEIITLDTKLIVPLFERLAGIR